MVEQHGKTLVPQIRFAGFTDPWEQRKLGELTESYSGGTPAAGESEFYGGSIPFIRSAEIAAESTELFLTEKGYESSSARMVKPGDVLYALYGATSGEVAVSRQKGAINQAILAILPRDDCDARYITAWLRKQKGYIVTTYLQGGQGNLSGVIVKNLEVFIPSLPEQQKIGFMLSHLDSLITLHQRKYDKLCVLKKSMLDKMFPKGGSLYPEIRFAGFTDPWEQRKLGDILQERNVRTSDFESNPIFSLTIEDGITPKTDRYERTSLITKTEDLFKIVSPNEFVTNPMNLRFGAFGYNKNSFSVCVSGYYDVFSIDNDKCSGFWNSYFKTSVALKRFDDAATGSLIEKRRVKYSTLCQLIFLMPKGMDEKKRIGAFFDRLDSLITLHQRKLELLRNIKKSMLDKMFV